MNELINQVFLERLNHCKKSFKCKLFYTLSRLSISFMVLYGVLKDMEVPDKAGNGVRGLGEPLGSFTKNFVNIGQQVPC